MTLNLFKTLLFLFSGFLLMMPLFGQSLSEKKKSFLLEQTGITYNPPSSDIGDPEKYYWPKTIARMEMMGVKDSLSNSWITLFADRSPFHFTLVGMVRIYNLFPTAPALQKHKLRILEKVFDRKDSYNCWTAEGTENHINMSRTSGYLFAQAAIEENFRKEEASQKLSDMKKWILDWSKLIYSKGTGEWNSGIYGNYNLIGWLNLYDFAKDPEVKSAAKAVCDYYASELALYYSWGVNGGAEMRGNGVGHNFGTSTSFLGWFWFSQEETFNPDWGREFIQTIHAATSTYKPDPVVRDLALKQIENPFNTAVQMPDYLITRKGFCSNQFYATNHFTLGSTSTRYGGWTGSTSQIITWKMVAKPANGKEVPFQLSGNGMFYKEIYGKIRDPFTQVVQNENVLIQMTRFPAQLDKVENGVNECVSKWSKNWKKDFLLRFPEEKWKPNVVKSIKGKHRKSASYLVLDERGAVSLEQGIYFVEYQGTFIAIRAIQQQYPIVLKQELKAKEKQFERFDWVTDDAAPGKLCGFVIEIGDFGSYGTFEKFKAAMKKTILIKPEPGNPMKFMYTDGKGRVLDVEFQPSGSFEEAIVDWGYGVVTQQTSIGSAQFVQPQWPEGDGHGKVAKLLVDGKENSIPVGVFEGPVLELKNGILRLHTNGKSFENHP